jgi:pSer/pThr/pTyr-binding forkhead associated (FHA) protein
MFRRLQWVALVIRNAGPGAGPRLAWLTPDGSVRQCAIPQDRPLIAGRDSAADVHEDHIRFSRRHFEIAAGPDGFVLRDTASRNGTRVNGRRIQNRLLRDGDMIEAGRKIFVFLLR